MTKDNIRKLLNRTIEIAIDSSRKLMQYAELISDKLKKLYETVEIKLKSWGIKISHFFKSDILEKKSNLHEKYSNGKERSSRDKERSSRDKERQTREKENEKEISK